MNKIAKLSPLTLALIIISTSVILPFPVAADQGPETDDLVIYFRASVAACYTMLTTGTADICGYEIGGLQYIAAITNPNIVLAPVVDFGMYEVDINNNYTIPTYPGDRSPTSYKQFRQAMAFLVDKATVISDYCAGFAAQIDQPIPSPSSGWMNANSTGANYPYIYNPVAAAAKLTAAGFVEGTTPNPDYDPAFPGSTQYLRIDPGTGNDMNPLVCYCRSDDLRRLYTGRMLYQGLRKLGVPCAVTECPSSVSYDPVMGDFNYHFYTGGWSLGRFPTHVYNLYHDDWYFSYGPNYVSGYNSTGDPNYPELNTYLKAVYYAATFGEAMTSCQDAMWLFTDECMTIPLWSSLAFWAYSKEVMGVTNMIGAGPENGYTFMKAYKEDGSALRYAIKAAPTAMNVLYSSWYYDRQVEDRLTLYGGMSSAPYARARDQADIVQDWYVETWDGGNKSKVTYWLRKDAYFVEPVTGNQREHLNMTAWLMSAFIQYALDDCWLASAYYPYIDHFILIDEDGDGDVFDDYCVEVYYNDLSYWFTYLCGGAMLPPRIWLEQSGPLTSYETEEYTMDFPDTVPLTGEIAWIDEVTYNVTPLTMFTDYNWIEGELVISGTYTGHNVTVKYWKVGTAGGYWPGGYDFATYPEIIEGAGMYYLTAYTAGIGGSATLKRNPYYWMETPLEHSEVDFYWVWGPTDESRRIDVDRCPRTGWFYVDMADMNYVKMAYNTQGTGIPDLFWFPGADLAPAGGLVDVYDAASIVGHWKEKFSETP